MRPAMTTASAFSDSIRRTPSRGEIPIVIHPSSAGQAIVINYPGYKGTIDGFNDKYATLATHLARSGVATVVRMPNMLHDGEDYKRSVVTDLSLVIEAVIASAENYCGFENPP